MTKSRRLVSLRYRMLTLAALLVCLMALFAPTTSPQSTTCCTRCLQRFQQCDANNIVCCQFYSSCVAQCTGDCPSCPGK